MTCIVAIKDGARLIFAGDSLGAEITTGYARLAVRPKVFSRETLGGNFLFGYTTSFRLGQLLEHDLVIPIPERDDDTTEYLVRKFIPAARACLKEGGEEPGIFIVGFRSHIFEVQTDWQVTEWVDRFSAIGSGANYALGALHASEDLIDPEEAVVVALQAASRFNAYVRPPFHVIDSDGNARTVAS
jgi:ATP-dependent protease HslVU (ClpYQ) peptidase subunit